MKREALSKLTNRVLDNNRACHVNIDVWHPAIKKVKYLLELGHDLIDPNNTTDKCTIFDLQFDNYSPDKAPGFRITMFCKEKEAKFMREYIKQRKEVNK